METILRHIVMSLLLIAAAPAVMAATAFDNFGDDFGYDGTAGVLASGTGGTFGHRSAALQFTASQSGKLTQLMLPLSAKNNGRPNDGLRLTLFEDVDDQLGATLETLVLDDICYVDFECEQGQLYTATAAGTTDITAGMTYWLLASSDLEDAEFTWYLTTETDPALVGIFNGLTGVFLFDTPPALRVDVIPDGGNGGGELPEPTTVLLAPLMAWAIRRAARGR